MLETLEGTRQILREGEGGRGLCIHAEHTRTSGSVPLVILSLTSPRSHFDIAGQNCGIKMVFLVCMEDDLNRKREKKTRFVKLLALCMKCECFGAI